MLSTPVAVGGVAVSVTAVHAVGRLADLVDDDLPELLRSDLLKLAATGLLVGYVAFVEGQSPATLSGRRYALSVAAALVVAGTAGSLAASVAIAVVADALGVDGDVAGTTAGIADRPLTAVLFTAAVAGTTEETLYRAYPIERVATLTGSPLLGGAVSVVGFGLAHAGYWDRGAAVRIAAQGLVLTALYLLVRSLPVLVAVHALHDAVGLVLARRAGGPPEAQAKLDPETDDSQ
ncbi:MAG: CPBP family intramembrane glutamic endopeptidase [Halolamina sp.]